MRTFEPCDRSGRERSPSAWSHCPWTSTQPLKTTGPAFLSCMPPTAGRVRHRRVCELDGREVGPEETARGWAAPDGRTVVIQDADLEALPLPTKRVIEVVGFIDETDVDPLLYARPYWVGAHGPGAQKPYALLVEALARSGRLVVCKVALRSRERLFVLRPRAFSTT
ncbi:Ku protein [Streptomyces lydicus]|uniref:Ku protein n=1 Tax=Streptomyces lydicus TaxID=47763 RepID=UPI00379F04FA